MAVKLSSKQIAQLAFLDASFPKVSRAQSLIEKLNTPSEAESAGRSLARILDELKVNAAGLSLPGVADSAANMASLARRTGGTQVRIRGLREGLAGLKINWDGARKKASKPEEGSGEGGET
jgi:hypothetical protein